MRGARGAATLLLALTLLAATLVTRGLAPQVSAANTAVEDLRSDDAGRPEAREFAGTDRYATSLAIARAFTRSANAIGFVDSVVLASGESLPDAAAAVGLAATQSAPLLLTKADLLTSGIKRFINDEFIAQVTIVGGPEAISPAVEEDLNAIQTVVSVERIAGADRYETAVAVAQKMAETAPLNRAPGSAGTYCGTGQISAVIVNIEDTYSDALAAGPMAYALELPILFTTASALPDSVTTYLTSSQVSHAVIVGGTNAVSENVVAQLMAARVSETTRIAGADRYETAFAMREALANCEGLAFSANTIALADTETPDGIAAAPLLSLGLDETAEGVTPLLFVHDAEIPEQTSAYLANLPTRTPAGVYIDLKITAFGGVEPVPDQVMQAAVVAATTSQPLTVDITANPGDTKVLFVFSNAVNVAPRPADLTDAEAVAAFQSSALNLAHYTLNGNPLIVGDSVATPSNFRFGETRVFGNNQITGSDPTPGAAVEVSIDGYRLRPGDEITVAGDKIKGVDGDNRRVRAANHVVEARPLDNLRPRVKIFAPENGHEFRIEVLDASLRWNSAFDRFDLASVSLGNQRLTDILPDDQSASPVTYVAHLDDLEVFGPDTEPILRLTICLFGFSDPSAPNGPNNYNDPDLCAETPPAGLRRLEAGDLITLAAGVFIDHSNNLSRTTTARVAPNNNKPALRHVTVSEPISFDSNGADAGLEDRAGWIWWKSFPNGDSNIYLQIVAKHSGEIGGDTGNDWVLSWSRLPSDEDTVPRVRVTIHEWRQVIQIEFDDDTTLHDLLLALLADSFISSSFDVNSDVLTNPSLGETALSGVSVTSGSATAFDPANLLERRSERGEFGKPSNELTPLTEGRDFVILTLSFNDIIKSFDYSAIQAANRVPFNLQNPFAVAVSNNGWILPEYGGEPTFPTKLISEVRLVIATNHPARFPRTAARLPNFKDTMILPAGLVTNYDDVPNDAISGVRLRPG